MNNKKHHELHFALVMLISFVTFNLGYVIDQTFRWTNHFDGFVNGIFHVIFFGIAWCVYMVPWSLIIFGLYRWKKWKRFRTAWLLSPSIVMFIAMISLLAIDHPSPQRRFQNFAKAKLPENAQDLRYDFSGGGLCDFGDTYYFRTTPDEVTRLIEEMDLILDERFTDDSYVPISLLPTWPSYKDWKNPSLYHRSSKESAWFYYLFVNETLNEVYVFVGCI